MVFDSLKQLVRHFGFQIEIQPKLDEFVKTVLAKKSYCIIEEDRLLWYIRKDQKDRYVSHYLTSPIFGAELQEASSEHDDMVLYQISNRILDYHHAIELVVFLQSGYVDAFWLDGFSFTYPSILSDHNPLTMSTQDDKNLDQEILDFQKAFEEYPESAMLKNYLGKLFIEKGDVSKASENFVDACKLEPFYAEPYSNMGALMWEMDSKEKGFSLFCESMLRNPFDQVVQDNFVKAGLELQEIEAMEEILGKVNGYFPSYSSLNYLRAVLLEKLGKKEEALKILQELLKDNPDDEKITQLIQELSEGQD